MKKWKSIFDITNQTRNQIIETADIQDPTYQSSQEILKLLKLTKFNGVCYYMLNNQWYVFTDDLTLKSAITSCGATRLLKKDINNAVEWANIISNRPDFDLSIESPNSNPYVVFNDGILELTKNGLEFEELDSETLNLLPINKLNYSYKHERKPIIQNIMRKFINWCAKGNEQEYKTILIMLGAALSNIQIEYVFNMYGDSGSGKSTLLDLAIQLTGAWNCVDVQIKTLNERFQNLPLVGKKLLVNNEVMKQEIDPTALKNLTTIGHKWNIEYKGKSKTDTITLPLNVILISNHILSVKDMTGLDRRLIPIQFPYKLGYVGSNFESLTDIEIDMVKPFRGNKKDFTEEALQAILPDVLEALRDFYFNHKMRFDNLKSTLYQNAFKEINEHNNNVLRWINESSFYADIISWQKTADGKNYHKSAKEVYEQYARDMHPYVKSFKDFKDTLTKHFGEKGIVGFKSSCWINPHKSVNINTDTKFNQLIKEQVTSEEFKGSNGNIKIPVDQFLELFEEWKRNKMEE